MQVAGEGAPVGGGGSTIVLGVPSVHRSVPPTGTVVAVGRISGTEERGPVGALLPLGRLVVTVLSPMVAELGGLQDGIGGLHPGRERRTAHRLVPGLIVPGLIVGRIVGRIVRARVAVVVSHAAQHALPTARVSKVPDLAMAGILAGWRHHTGALCPQDDPPGASTCA